MSRNILTLLDLLLEVPQGTDHLRELILGLAFDGQLSDDPTKPDWDMDKNLKDLGKMIRGITYAKSDSRKDQEDNLTPLLGAANIQQEINYSNLTYVPSKLIKSEQLLLNGDILICMSSGSKHLVGKAAPVQDPIRASFGAFCAVFRSTSLVDSNFLALFFHSPKYRKEISSLSRGIGINNLRIGDIESISIPLPPLKEQANIVNRVSELLNLCNEIHKSRNFQLALATSVRKSFVNAISAAQTPEELQIAWDRIQKNWDVIANTPASIESLRGLILDLAVTGRLTKSSSRQNHTVTRDKALSEMPWSLFAPRDWNLTTLGDACLKISDGTHKTPKYQESGVPFLSIKDISSGIIDFSKTRFISQSEHDELCKRIKPSRGDVLFCRIGTLGKAITIETDRDFSIFVSLGLLRPKHYLNPKFLELALNSPISHKQFESIKAGGSHTQKLNLGAMSKYIIWYPDPETQSEIVQQVSDLMNLCDQLELKVKIMDSLSEKFAQSIVFSTT